MRITHYTPEPGGVWLPWDLGEPTDIKRMTFDKVLLWGGDINDFHCVHAVRFENGEEWDAINGDRKIITLH